MRLPVEPQNTFLKNAFDLKPDLTLEDTSRNTGYPDEFMNAFLSSIKVFGYLDRPVFHELAKNLQTKKLKPGEILFSGDKEDKEDLDFYIVVEGKMQVFIKTNNDDGEGDEESEEDQEIDTSGNKKYSSQWNGHHLLNEVRSGGTVSSLFSILAILSEDLELPSPLVSKKENNNDSDTNTDLAEFIDKNVSAGHSINRPDSADIRSGADESNAGDITPGPNAKLPLFDIETAQFKESLAKLELPSPKGFRSVHPNLVARAATNTTLAVIPASSFRNLAQKFPKSASHMVSVILTRFQRVTFLTLQRYLGLSQELLEIEKKVNEIAGTGLPSDLFPSALVESCAWRLSHQHSDTKPGSPYHTGAVPLVSPITPATTTHSKAFGLDSFTMSPSDDDIRFISGDIDERLCDAVFSSIAQLIGLTPSKGISTTSELISQTKRPSVTSQIGMSIERFYYSSRHNAGSSITPSIASKKNSLYFEDDVMSVNSSMADSATEDGFSSFQPNTNPAAIPDIQLLFFKQGNIVLKEGERCPGLYFVLDGTLEASSGADEFGKSKNSSSGRSGKSKKLFLVQPGGLAGYLGALTGNTSFVTMTAKTDVLCGLMPKIVLDRYVEKYPNVLLCLAKRLVQQLSPLVLHIDVALEWGQVNAGQVLCKQGINSLYFNNNMLLGELSHSIFIVLTGRLRSIKENEAKEGNTPSIEIQGEYGQSESVGELEVLLDSPRTSTIHVKSSLLPLNSIRLSVTLRLL